MLISQLPGNVVVCKLTELINVSNNAILYAKLKWKKAGGGGGGPIGSGKDHFRSIGYWLAAFRIFLNFVNINSGE